MGERELRDSLQEILSAGGIEINGGKSWDIRVKDPRFYRRVLRDGSLGLGESYMEGWWDCPSLDDFFSRITPSQPEEKLKKNWRLLLFLFQSRVLNAGKRSKAFQIGQKHYDLGYDLYRNMLDRRMIYSCGYWRHAQDLDEAQEAKLDLICRKVGLKAGERILDIGCGWGGLARYASERYGVEVVGITVSKDQFELGREFCKGLPVEIRLEDYRDLNEKFDHIISVGMFEHVGYKNYRAYMEVVERCLKDKGLFLLHTIGHSFSKTTGDQWTNRYIFPNSMVPSLKQISDSAEGVFVVEDLHNIGAYYDTTLEAWLDNFERNAENLNGRYDERFRRMWRYYLQSFRGAFRSRYLHVWQIVFSRKGVPGGYLSVR